MTSTLTFGFNSNPPLPQRSSCNQQTKMNFSNLYSSVLTPFVEIFKNAKNDKARKTVVNNAVDAVKKSKDLLEDAEDLPSDLKIVCLSFGSLCFFIHA